MKPAVIDFSYYLYKHLELAFPLVNSLERISNIFYDDDEELYKCINNAKNDIEKGKLFSYGIKKCPFYFSKKMVRIIEKGEKNGLLVEVFRDFSEGVADEKFNKMIIARPNQAKFNYVQLHTSNFKKINR